MTLDDLTRVVAAELLAAGVPYQEAKLRAHLEADIGRMRASQEAELNAELAKLRGKRGKRK